MTHLELIEAQAIRRGYRIIETMDEDGIVTKRLVRTDGSTAIIARRNAAAKSGAKVVDGLEEVCDDKRADAERETRRRL